MENILEKKQIVFEFSIKEFKEDSCGKSVKDESKVDTVEKTFANCSWAEFIAIIRAGNVRKFCKVGDMKTMKLKTGELIRVAIAGFDHDISEEGFTLPVTLTFVDCLSENYPMNHIATNISGWKGSIMRNKTMAELFELLPDDLKCFIVASKKDNATLDKLFLPSEVEVWGKNQYGEDDESNKQYEFYKNKHNRIKFCANNEEYATYWSLRSPLPDNKSSFCIVDSSGAYAYNYASNEHSIAPCFAIN